jgi:transmembrane sensor
MEHQQIIDLIDKYLAGTCTAEEARTVEQWYASHQLTSKDFYMGDLVVIQASASRSLAAIMDRLGIEDEPVTNNRLNKIRKMQQWLAAACIVILFSAGTWLYFNAFRQAETYTICKTVTGETKHIKLPDGTTVWLNAQSTLKYSSAFNREDRQVYLDGEAFFDVKHDQDKPFEIHSGKVKTHVLGTAFAVSAYAGSLIQTVTVIRGKVQVSDDKQVLAYLLPNQELEYTASLGKGTVIHVNAEKVVSWTAGKLSFIDMPMQDIAVHLQKWYGVNFVFKNQELKRTRFTATFNNKIHLNDLLAVMYDVSHVSYRIDTAAKTVTYL